MRSSGASTSDTFTVHRKQLNGLAARLTAKVYFYLIALGKPGYKIILSIERFRFYKANLFWKATQ